MKHDDGNADSAERHLQRLIGFEINKRQVQSGAKNLAFGKHNCALIDEFRL